MSSTPDEYLEALKLREQISRIDLEQARIGTLVAEQHKLMAEQRKLMAEQASFEVEARGFVGSRHLTPWLAIAGLVGGLFAIADLMAQFFRHAG